MKVAIVGSGWVGGNLGRGLQELGHDVSFHDRSKERVEELEKNGFNATSDLEQAVRGCKISFLCVPTPTNEGKIDLNYLDKASRNLSSHMNEMADFPVVTIKSTVVPGTTERIVIPKLEEGSSDEAGEDFGVCMNPEFMTEISSTWTEDESYERNFFSEDKTVIGEHSSRAGDVLERLYEGLDSPVVRTDLRTAEMIKYACNCMLSTKISYWNQIFLLCEKLGIDSDEVAETAAMDPRIGEYGTVHGKAFGGKCLPKDLRALIAFAEEELGKEPELLKAVEDINDHMADEYGVRE